MKTKYTAIVFTILCSVCALLCVLKSPSAKPLPRVPFVEKWRDIHGVWLDEGIHGNKTIDFPLYDFSRETRTLTDYDSLGFDIHAAWVLLYGSGASLHGDAGMGSCSELTAIYSLPCTTNDISFISTGTNGTVTLRCWGQLHTLAPGDIVSNQTSWVETNVLGKMAFRKQFVGKERIENFGFVERSNVKRQR